MELAFEKWHGCRNDFVVVWISDTEADLVLDSLRRQAVALCDRHAGIGGDGILVLQTPKRGDPQAHTLTIINSDGSLAKNCGNGLRCAALSVRKAHIERGGRAELPEACELQVAGVPMVCRYLNAKAITPMVAVELGIPTLNEAVPWFVAGRSFVEAAAQAAGLRPGSYEWGACSIGNPHLVIQSERADRAMLQKLGPSLQELGPWAAEGGINVHLVRPKDLEDKDQARARQELGHGMSELVQAFVWERGAGETQACGSGAGAIAALALHSGLVSRDGWYGVDMPGGRLYVRQDAADEPAVLAGPGQLVYSGQFTL